MKDKHLNNFLKLGLLLLVISLVYPFAVNYFFDSWQKSGTFGDTFGALNALFSGLAFSGVIITILIQKTELKNQREELMLQRTEMQETRKEFLLNRTTNIIYNQLERFEKSLSELTINFENDKYIGNDAVLILYNQIGISPYNPEKTEEENKTLLKEYNIRLSKIHIENRFELEKFAHNGYNSVNVLKSLLFKSNFEIEELNDLKNLYFDNIGHFNMSVISDVSKVASEQLYLLEIDDYMAHDIEPGNMMSPSIFFKSIIEFYNIKFKNDNYEDLKDKWISGKGNR